MHYRDKARNSMQRVRARQAKAVVYVEITPLSDGGFLYNDFSFFVNYEHENPKWQAQQEIDRSNAIRNSHMYLYKNVLYYAQGIENYDECKLAIEYWHNAREQGCIRIYRLDFCYAQEKKRRYYTDEPTD